MKHGIIVGVVALVLSGGMAAGVASAQAIPDRGLTLDELVTWLRSAGYTAEVRVANDGKSNVYSSANGIAFQISPYDCNAGPACRSIQFRARFDTKGAFNAARANEWNRENRWVRAYIDDSNDPWLEMDVQVSPGGTYANLNDEFTIWRDGLVRFQKQHQIRLEAPLVTVARIDVVSRGLYDLEIVKRTPAANTATGSRSTVTNVKMIESTETIPARLGAHFGFEFTVVGEPAGAVVGLRKVTKYPAAGLTNPDTHETFYRDESTLEVTIGRRSYTGYSLDREFEIVAGTWTVELWYGDRKLAEQSFQVVKP